MQAFARLAAQGQAHEAAAEAGHEVDGLGADVVGREHQVAFVFAVFFVHENDHAAGGELGHDVFDGGDGNGGE